MLEIAHEYEIPSLIEGRWIVQDIMDGTDDNRVRNCVVACQQPGLSGTHDHSDVTAAHELQFNLLSLRGQRQSRGIAVQFRGQRLADEVEVDSVEHYGRLWSQFQNRRQMRFGWISAREHDDVYTADRPVQGVGALMSPKARTALRCRAVGDSPHPCPRRKGPGLLT